MKIAAFDLGSHVACAHNMTGAGNERVTHWDAKGDRVERAGQILGWLKEAFQQFEDHGGLDVVVYERPFARGQAATRSLWGVAGILEALAGAYGWPCIDYTPGEIKKHAIGKGDAEKDEMILAASLTGYMGDNEHEADAWCLMRFAEDNIKPGKSAKAWKSKPAKRKG